MDEQRAPYDNPLKLSQRSASAHNQNGAKLDDKPQPSSKTLVDALGKLSMQQPARRFPEEEDEDLLRETDDRFVLFPIKYREVSHQQA